MNTHDELRGALQRRADGVDWDAGDHPLSLDDVRGRARGIRRRRVAVGGLAAVAVLAIAVPVGLGVTGPNGTRSVDPANPTPGPAPSSTAEPTPDDTTPSSPVDLLLTTDRPVGAEPSLTTVTPEAITPPDGAMPVSVDADYYAVVPLGTGWVALRNEGNDAVLDVVDAIGGVEASYTAQSSTGLAVSRDGTVVAYTAPGGVVMTLVDDEVPREIHDADGPAEVAAVDGSGSCGPADDGCTVYVNRLDSTQSFSVTSQGVVSDVPGMAWVSAVAEDGRVSGMTRVDDYGSCNAVQTADGERLWRTCDYKDLRFSPSGRYVMGVDAQSDGAGSATLAILDAETGEVVTSVVNNRQTQAFVAQAEWNEFDQVLMTVGQDGAWRVMSLTPSGDFTAVRGGEYESIDAYVSDLHLETRP